MKVKYNHVDLINYNLDPSYLSYYWQNYNDYKYRGFCVPIELSLKVSEYPFDKIIGIKSPLIDNMSYNSNILKKISEFEYWQPWQDLKITKSWEKNIRNDIRRCHEYGVIYRFVTEWFLIHPDIKEELLEKLYNMTCDSIGIGYGLIQMDANNVKKAKNEIGLDFTIKAVGNIDSDELIIHLTRLVDLVGISTI